MVACCDGNQLFIRFRRTQSTTMAMTTGKIQSDFRQHLIILSELADLGWIDLILVGTEITREFCGIRPGRLDQVRHMALGAGKLHAQMGGVILLPGFIRMALFALQVDGLLACLAELDDTLVRIMTENAFQDSVFALEEVMDLYSMLDETILGDYWSTGIGTVAG